MKNLDRWFSGRRRLLSLTIVIAAAPVVATPAARTQTAVLAGGCFWGVEGVFEHVQGVTEVVSGYAGGAARRPGGSAGPGAGVAEAVRIRFDPTRVSYEQLLAIYFQVAHDPTQLDRQGPDVGPRYRSAIFPQTPEQKRAAIGAIAKLKASRLYPGPIVTRIEGGAFKVAASDQQDYMRRNPRSRYVIVHDLPKLEKLKRAFPALWKA